MIIMSRVGKKGLGWARDRWTCWLEVLAWKSAREVEYLVMPLMNMPWRWEQAMVAVMVLPPSHLGGEQEIERHFWEWVLVGIDEVSILK